MNLKKDQNKNIKEKYKEDEESLNFIVEAIEGQPPLKWSNLFDPSDKSKRIDYSHLYPMTISKFDAHQLLKTFLEVFGKTEKYFDDCINNLKELLDKDEEKQIQRIQFLKEQLSRFEKN